VRLRGFCAGYTCSRPVVLSVRPARWCVCSHTHRSASASRSSNNRRSLHRRVLPLHRRWRSRPGFWPATPLRTSSPERSPKFSTFSLLCPAHLGYYLCCARAFSHHSRSVSSPPRRAVPEHDKFQILNHALLFEIHLCSGNQGKGVSVAYTTPRTLQPSRCFVAVTGFRAHSHVQSHSLPRAHALACAVSLSSSLMRAAVVLFHALDLCSIGRAEGNQPSAPDDHPARVE
jgi:hypothetical protein